ncbi:unnamed protein product, partial [marine sediment metagenome]
SACHRDGGRLQKIAGIYIPGRDTFTLVEWLGWGMVLVTLVGILAHGLIRFAVNGKGLKP